MSNLIVLSPANNRVVVTPGFPFIQEGGKLWQLKDASWKEVKSTFVYIPELKKLKSRRAVLDRMASGEWTDARRGKALTPELQDHLKWAASRRLSKEELGKLAREIGRSETYTRMLVQQARKENGIRHRAKNGCPGSLQRSYHPAPQEPPSVVPGPAAQPMKRTFSSPGIGNLALLTQAEARILLSAARAAANPTPELTLAIQALEGQVQR